MKHRRSAAEARSVSLLQLARLLGKHRNTVASWLSQGCPALSSARREARVEWQLDPAAVVEWLLARERSQERERLAAKHAAQVERLRAAVEGDSSGPVSRREALRRKSVAEARLREIELGGAEERYVPIDQVEHVWSGILKLVRQGLLGLPSRTAPRIHDVQTIPEIREILAEAVHEILTELSDTEVKHSPAEPGVEA